MKKCKLLLVGVVALSLILASGNNADAWPWSKKDSNISKSNQKNKKSKKQSKRKNKKKQNKKNKKNTK